MNSGWVPYRINVLGCVSSFVLCGPCTLELPWLDFQMAGDSHEREAPNAQGNRRMGRHSVDAALSVSRFRSSPTACQGGFGVRYASGDRLTKDHACLGLSELVGQFSRFLAGIKEGLTIYGNTMGIQWRGPNPIQGRWRFFVSRRWHRLEYLRDLIEVAIRNISME